jgi:hypothetical protein
VTVPKATTVATVEEELLGVRCYAERHGWTVSWDSETLRLTFEGKHPNDNRPIRVVAALDDYRALPPAWSFEVPDTGIACLLKPAPVVGQSSIFNDKCSICAPFNRRAYKQCGGPHGDWGGPECWLNVRGHAWATTLAAMFAVIVGHLKASPGIK